MTPAPGAGAEASWFDNHCHLEPGEAGDAALAAAAAAGVRRVITVGTDPDRSVEAAAVAAAHPGTVWATAGIHPHEAAAGGVDRIEALLDDPAVVAVGECGLDFYYDHSPRHEQRRIFAAQIELARRAQLPLVIHSRDAWSETFAILEDVGVPERTVFHCFTGGPAEAERCVAMGAHLSFSGIVTFKTAVELRDAAARCPLDRLMVETDAPYLAPVPHRGKRNQPAWVVEVGEAVAAARGEDPAALAAATWATTCRFYGLPG